MEIEYLYKIFLENPIIITDSRKVKKGCLFFALKGENFDGNNYAQHAISEGCAYAIVDDVSLSGQNQMILVNDVLKALQELSNYHRRQLKTPLIGITGTNGKTTTKELIASVLMRKYNVLYTQGNFNNHIGVPLTLLNLNKSHEIGIIEMGANHKGEIKELCDITEPDYGIITNIGKAHIEGFGSFENVRKTKKELYDYIKAKGGKIFYNTENNILQEIVKDLNLENVGFGGDSNISAKALESDKYLRIEGKINKNSFQVETKLIGNYNLENVLAALCIGDFFGVELSNSIEAIKEYVPSNNRSQFMKTENNSLILDAYNANPTSVNAALRNFFELKLENKVVVLGDMLELGNQTIAEHEEIVKLVKGNNIIKIILVGNIYASLGVTDDKIETFVQVEDLIDRIQLNKIKDCNILIKGSRGIQLEKIVEFL